MGADFLETILEYIVNFALHCFEFAGVIIIIWTGAKGFYHWIKKVPSLRLELAQGMALGLEFKLGSEILRTVIVREFQEVLFVAAIIAVRAALTILIHWEIKQEKEEAKEQDAFNRNT